MKKAHWSIILVGSGVNGHSRCLPFNRTIFIVCLLVMLLGLIGLGRCIYFFGSCGIAKLGLYYNNKENYQLKSKVQFLSRFVLEERARVDHLMTFEDNMRMKFGMEQINSDIRKVGVGGRPSTSELLLTTYDDPVLMKADTIKQNVETLLRQMLLEDSTFGTMADVIDRQYDVWSQRPAVLPIGNGRFTSLFGYRVHPFTGETLFHEGVDISNEIGTPIHATANGIVAFVGYKDYFGNTVVLSHPASGFKTIFGHMKKYVVSEGQAVHRGDLIGYLGNSGRSTGPHVHYEIHKLSDIVNPLDYVLPSDTMVD